jgi:hypothetical protein
MKASSTTVDAGSLETLAENANRMHKQVEGAERQASKSAKEAVRLAVEAGEILLLAKEEVGHGRFTKWIEENFEGAPCRARLYRRLATAVEQGRIDPAEVSSLAEAERLLREQDAEPKPQEFEPEEPDEKGDFREPGAESDEKEPEAQSADLDEDDFDFDDDEEDDEPEQTQEDESESASSKKSSSKERAPSKRKDVDPLRDALNGIGRALGAADDEKRIEWAQILRDEIDIYMGSLDQEEAA